MRDSVRCVLSVLVLAVAACTDSTSPVETGTVTGTVTNASTGLPIASATITAASRTSQSASDGSYSIGQVPVGRQRITASLTGYSTVADSVTVSAAAPVVFDVVLHVEGPPGPNGLTAVAGAANGSVVLTWNPIAGATSYSIYWGVTDNPLHDGTRIDNAVSPYTQQGLSGGTRRYYVLTATTSLGESGPSATASAEPVNSISLALVTISRTGGPDPTIGPEPNGFVHSSTRVAVFATSQYSLQSVVAHIGTVTVPMVFVPRLADGSGGFWDATLDLATLSSPSDQPFSITAMNVLGDTASLSYPVRYDNPPVVTISLPSTGTVATPFLTVRATCTDDGATGCATLKVQTTHQNSGILEPPLATGQATVDQVISLAAYDGENISLGFIGVDASGQFGGESRSVFVELNSHLVQVATTGDGTCCIVDASSDRLLAVNDTQLDDTVSIVDRASGASVVAYARDGKRRGIQGARLTSLGAMFLATSDFPTNAQAYEWRGGVLAQPVGSDYVYELAVSGDFALFWLATHGPLVRRDVIAGSNVTVSATAPGGNSVAANGDVAFWDDYNISIYRAGTTTKLTTDGSLNTPYGEPVTDGTHVVFSRHVAGQHQTLLYDAAGSIVLATDVIRGGYTVNNGWIAFTRPDAGGVHQIWTRSPGGVEAQLTILGRAAQIEVLGPTGEVVFLSDNRRYRASAGSSAVDIGAYQGKPLYIGSQLHIALGASLFVVN